ncbi:hypothetical protein ACSBOB_26800 [Mesorhizobium sp. ASY16-5R]|uniref:hypothetical protein n=1 Tax=Mesorhizobium sp. ASY16-5R TaxID=3445772 RepID=UPI003FA0E9C8
MKADLELSYDPSPTTESKLLVGHFVRRQGQFGTVAVVGRVSPGGVETISEPKRLFPRDGFVETHGPGHHAGLNPGDWVNFDVVKNPRPRAPEYKVVHLKRLPRFAVLPESTMPAYRALLTREGWAGDARPGLWAFRLSSDMVLVAELEGAKDRRLRLTRVAAREVKCYCYDENSIVRLGTGKTFDDVFIMPEDGPMTSFDWSDEADHIGRVIRSLAGANDPRFSEIMTWLDLHHEEGTGRVSAASGDKEAALEALRSGELAARLRADRELMDVYLAAALQNDAVREAVAAYVKDGHGAEWKRLQAELAEEIAIEKAGRLEVLSSEIDAERAAGVARMEHELAQHDGASRATQAARFEQAERDVAIRIKGLEATYAIRRDELDRGIADQAEALTDARADVVATEAELKGLRGEADDARGRLADLKREIDRLLAIAERLGPADPLAASASPRAGGIVRAFPNYLKSGVVAKAEIISRNIMLSENGKELLNSLLVMFLSGEMPILVGEQVADLLLVAETIICPGRYVSLEADPTLISLDDLWARPGSGMPTLLASAADAASDGGAVLIAIHGIERSGARFWMPALAEALRRGGLPRSLFVCCTVRDRDHDEVRALPNDAPWIEIADAFRPEAYSTAPTLLSQSRIILETLDPGPMPADLSAVSAMTLGLEQHRSVGLVMRAARMFAEATILLGDEQEARRLVLNLVKPLAPKSSQ